jgi:hypothetical protein
MLPYLPSCSGRSPVIPTRRFLGHRNRPATPRPLARCHRSGKHVHMLPSTRKIGSVDPAAAGSRSPEGSQGIGSLLHQVAQAVLAETTGRSA